MWSVHVWEGSASRAALSERERGLPNREGATCCTCCTVSHHMHLQSHFAGRVRKFVQSHAARASTEAWIRCPQPHKVSLGWRESLLRGARAGQRQPPSHLTEHTRGPAGLRAGLAVMPMICDSVTLPQFIHSFSTQPGRLLLEGGPLWPGPPGPPSPPGACSVLEGCAQR